MGRRGPRQVFLAATTFVIAVFVYSNIFRIGISITDMTSTTNAQEMSFAVNPSNHTTNIIVNTTVKTTMITLKDTTTNMTVTSSSAISPGPLQLNNRSSWRPDQTWIDRCVFNVTNDKTFQRPFHVLWRRYTLGDCFKMCRNCYHKDCVQQPWKTRKKKTGCYQKTPRNDTFSVLYYFRACSVAATKDNVLALGGNWTILQEIIQEQAARSKHDNFTVPDVDQVVIHLRLGDVIENVDDTNVSTMLWQGADPWHTSNYKTAIKSIGEYLDDLSSLNDKLLLSDHDDDDNNTTSTPTAATPTFINKVAIRGGSHDPNYYQKSRVYSECLRRAIQQAGYTVEMVVEGTTPDEDFYYIGHSKYLIVSSGGYSRILGEMAKRNGGQVIGRVFGGL